MKIIFEGTQEQIKEEMRQFLQVPTKQAIKKTGTYADAWNNMTPNSQKLLYFLAKKNDWVSKEEVKAIMEEFGDTTESLYLHIADNYDFRKLTKKKTIQLLKTKI